MSEPFVESVHAPPSKPLPEVPQKQAIPSSAPPPQEEEPIHIEKRHGLSLLIHKIATLIGTIFDAIYSCFPGKNGATLRENGHLQRRVSLLTTENASLADKTARLNSALAEVEKLTKKVKELRARLQRTRGERDHDHSSYRKESSHNKGLLQQIVGLQQEIATLKDGIHLAQQEEQKEQANAAYLSRVLSDAQNENGRLHQEVEHWKQAAKRVSNELETIQTERDERKALFQQTLHRHRESSSMELPALTELCNRWYPDLASAPPETFRPGRPRAGSGIPPAWTSPPTSLENT